VVEHDQEDADRRSLIPDCLPPGTNYENLPRMAVGIKKGPDSVAMLQWKPFWGGLDPWAQFSSGVIAVRSAQGDDLAAMPESLGVHELEVGVLPWMLWRRLVQLLPPGPCGSHPSGLRGCRVPAVFTQSSARSHLKVLLNLEVGCRGAEVEPCRDGNRPPTFSEGATAHGRHLTAKLLCLNRPQKWVISGWMMSG